jgi:hypothetical protein
MSTEAGNASLPAMVLGGASLLPDIPEWLVILVCMAGGHLFGNQEFSRHTTLIMFQGSASGGGDHHP